MPNATLLQLNRCPICVRAIGIGRVLIPLFFCATLATPVRSQPDPGADAPQVIAALKAAYLECDRSASQRLLAIGEALECSQVSEALLTRVFAGDFDQLLAWWRSEKALRQDTQIGAR